MCSRWIHTINLWRVSGRTGPAFDAGPSRRHLLMGAAVAAGALLARSAPVRAATPGRLALSGFDPVSYFTPGHPEPGSSQFPAAYDETSYQFVSDKHRKMFAANPRRYAPLFRDYCTTGVFKGVKVEGDHDQWTIWNGKLLVFGNAAAKGQFEANPVEVFNGANANWRLLKNN